VGGGLEEDFGGVAEVDVVLPGSDLPGYKNKHTRGSKRRGLTATPPHT
jgi:hypothetical protein